MGLISAKCTNCGKVIQLDSSMESGFCLYCGAKVLVKAAEAFYRAEGGGAVEVEGKNSTVFDNQVIIIRQIIEEHREDAAKIPKNEIKSCLDKMRNLDPMNAELLLYDCLFSFLDNVAYGGYEVSLSIPEATLRQNASREKKGLFSAGHEVRTYSPESYASWKYWIKEGDERYVKYLVQSTKKLNKILNIGNQNTITQFAEFFMRLISNQTFSYYSDCEISIKNGIIKIFEISKNPRFSYLEDFLDEITYIRSHRSNPELCVADNVIEFFIPFLREMLPSPNKELLIDALYNECDKYPHSNYVRS